MPESVIFGSLYGGCSPAGVFSAWYRGATGGVLRARDATHERAPGRVFSGKEHPSPDARAVFFCYSLPAPDATVTAEAKSGETVWTEEAGSVKWYLYDLATEGVVDQPSEIIDLIRSTPETPRHRSLEDKTLSQIRRLVDRHIKNTYLKQVQAPVGVKPVLKAWMELS